MILQLHKLREILALKGKSFIPGEMRMIRIQVDFFQKFLCSTTDRSWTGVPVLVGQTGLKCRLAWMDKIRHTARSSGGKSIGFADHC